MKVSCASCGEPIPAADLDVRTGLARCARCDEVFSLRALLDAAETGGDLPAPVPRMRVPLPGGIEVFREGKGLLMERSWFTWGVIPLMAFTAFWDGFLVVWYTIALTQGLWQMALFATLHLAIGVALAYAVLCTLFNVTTVEITDGRLRISHGPIPAPGTQVDLEARELDQVYCQRKVTTSNDSTTTTYEVHAQLADGRHRLLLGSLEESGQALYIEQEIEAFLGIVDRPVEGEMQRPGRIPGRTGARPALPPAPRRSPAGTSAGAAGASGEDVQLAEVDLRQDGSCPVCGEEVVGAVKICPGCAGIHHPECWDYSGGCATYGCSRAAS